MSRVLLTGGSGYVGRHAARKLTDMGFEVHAIGRRAPDCPTAVFHQCDLLNHSKVAVLTRKLSASHLLHLAWDVEPGFWTSPANLDWTAASLMLLRSFTEAGGKRAVFAGTCAEYSWKDDGRLDEETTKLVPATLYGSAKDSLRRVAMAYAQSKSVSFAWGRIFFMYGPGERPKRLVRDAIDALLNGRTFPATAGLQRRDFIHVEDVAAAFCALLNSAVHGAVNIGSGNAVTVRSVLELVGAATGNPGLLQFGTLPLAPDEPPVIEASVNRLMQDVGFAPRYSLTDGLTQTVDWYREQVR